MKKSPVILFSQFRMNPGADPDEMPHHALFSLKSSLFAIVRV